MWETLTTYKTWRQNHNPWTGNNFIGYLNPDNPDDANIIDEIHSYIDEYFNPRYLGVEDEDRFSILFHVKLASIESNFFNSIRLDKHYDDILNMLKNIDMLSDTKTDTNLSGTNESTITGKRTDNLKSTTSSRNDQHDEANTHTDFLGARDDTQTSTTDSTASKSINYGESVSTSSTEYGKTNTHAGTSNNTTNTTNKNTDTTDGTNTVTDDLTNVTNGRVVTSNTPQSNITTGTAGIDAPVNWNYASGLQDNKNTQKNTGTKTTKNNQTITTDGTNNTTNETTDNNSDTLSGTDTTTNTRNKYTDSESGTSKDTTSNSLSVGEQENRHVDNILTHDIVGEQSVSNTGTQDNTQTENRSHNQTGKYSKLNDNSGRNDNLAKIRLEWRDLLHKTISSYMYLFNELDKLFFSVWC